MCDLVYLGALSSWKRVIYYVSVLLLEASLKMQLL
jgi:hypothetical protein